MKIKNFMRAAKQIQTASHGGVAKVALYEIWAGDDFDSHVDFIDRVTVPPGATIGYHRHGHNEEMYIVLSGQAKMTIEDEEVIVSQGDMILNPALGAHGLVNHSEQDIDLLVIQLGID